jgi:hypothetical protein
MGREYEGPGEKNARTQCNHENAPSSCNVGAASAATSPTDWIALCRTILIAHREELQKSKSYKRFGWQRIRDLIMVHKDKYKDGKLIERSQLFARQDLEKFVAGFSVSGPKFALIDRYIRLIDIQGMPDSLRKTIRERGLQAQMDVLAGIYQQRDIDSGSNKLLDDMKGRYLYSRKIEGAWYKSIFIKFAFAHKSIAHIVVGYCPELVDVMTEKDWANIIFYEGFLVPFPYREGASVAENHDELLCVVKLFRAEFRGWRMMGYADGELQLHYHPKKMGLHGLARAVLDYPNPAVNPALLPYSNHRKYYDTPIEEEESIIRAVQDAEQGGRSGYFEHDFFRLSRFHVNLLFDGEHDQKFDRIVSKCYSGYLF